MKTRIKLIKDEYDLYYPLEYGDGKARVFLQPQPFRETTYNGEHDSSAEIAGEQHLANGGSVDDLLDVWAKHYARKGYTVQSGLMHDMQNGELIPYICVSTPGEEVFIKEFESWFFGEVYFSSKENLHEFRSIQDESLSLHRWIPDEDFESKTFYGYPSDAELKELYPNMTIVS